MKKHISFLIVIIASVCILASCSKNDSSSSYQPKSYDKSTFHMYVVPEGLNVRKSASADAPIVTVLHQNDEVVTDRVSDGGWYKISAQNGSVTGYVNASYLSDKPTQQEKQVSDMPQVDVKAQQKKTTPQTEQKTETQPAQTTTTSEESKRPTLQKLSKN